MFCNTNLLTFILLTSAYRQPNIRITYLPTEYYDREYLFLIKERREAQRRSDEIELRGSKDFKRPGNLEEEI
jgi:hypothetical protein